MTLPTLPPMTWLRLAPEELGRWSWERHLSWPMPLDSSRTGRWEPELTELLAGLTPTAGDRPRGEERLLATLAEVLSGPDECAFAIRSVNGDESHFAAVRRGAEVVAVVDQPGEVRIARIDETMIAVTVAAQLPRLAAAPTIRMAVPAGTASLLSSGLQRGADPETMRNAMASAGIPEAIMSRLLAGDQAVTGSGMIGAVRFDAGSAKMSERCASWTEMAGGALIAASGPGGDVVWEPFTAAAAARCLADALTAVRT